jgi:hypothetical protein
VTAFISADVIIKQDTHPIEEDIVIGLEPVLERLLEPERKHNQPRVTCVASMQRQKKRAGESERGEKPENTLGHTTAEA